MILDPSALLAILMEEPEADDFLAAIQRADRVVLSAAGYLEAAIVVEGRGSPVARALLDTVLEDFGIEVEPVTFEQARLARAAFRSFGKGIHPAGLNYGDCFTYALAKALRQPVLFKGNDFRQTDLIPAV